MALVLMTGAYMAAIAFPGLVILLLFTAATWFFGVYRRPRLKGTSGSSTPDPVWAVSKAFMVLLAVNYFDLALVGGS